MALRYDVLSHDCGWLTDGVMIDNNFTYWMKHSVVYCQSRKHSITGWLKRSVVYCLSNNYRVNDL